jgi:hypothetical protein
MAIQLIAMTPEAFPFLDLPMEIRLMVYERRPRPTND